MTEATQHTPTHNVVIWASQDGASGKESAGQCRRHQRHRLDPWVGKIPSSRKWQPTSVFLPGKSHTQRSLASYSPWGCKALDMTEQLSRQAHNVVIYLEKGKIYRKKLLEQKQFSKVGIHKVTIQKLQSYKPTTVIKHFKNRYTYDSNKNIRYKGLTLTKDDLYGLSKCIGSNKEYELGALSIY